MNNEEVVVKPKKKTNIVSIICAIVGVLCIGIAGYSLWGIYEDYKVGDDIYE